MQRKQRLSFDYETGLFIDSTKFGEDKIKKTPFAPTSYPGV